MINIEISLITYGTIEIATVECDRRNRTLSIIMPNGLKKKYSAPDLYKCFGMLRADYPETKFLCKGAKLNVHPSSMSSQMSSGLVAYELELGKPSEEANIVRIFDYEDKNITNNIDDQKAFYKAWRDSLKNA
ncbi:hypothetical protein [Pseudomonas frederiksbergensis]|uniref:hypothetical protein n=1 Tax=Pseudomonas frederiksbergensis TaxID=104087 RepID=UPI003D24570F